MQAMAHLGAEHAGLVAVFVDVGRMHQQQIGLGFPDDAARAGMHKGVAVGMDLLDGTVAVRGWEQGSEWTAERFLRHLASLGVQTVICTDISRDGILSGSNHDLYKQLNRALPVDLIASGGVSGLEDLLALKDLGMAGAIVGKAYYSGVVSLRNALREVQEC